MVVPPALIVAVGKAFTVTVVPADAAVPCPVIVMVTVYVPLVVTIIACAVDPVLHKYPSAVLDVSVTLPPEQKVVAPDAVIIGVGTPHVVNADVT